MCNDLTTFFGIWVTVKILFILSTPKTQVKHQMSLKFGKREKPQTID